jgi:uncharacterized protein YjdB
LQGSGFNSATNLQLQFMTPLNLGQEAPTRVAGTISGQTVSLAGNYAVTYSSADPSVATVNGDGLVIGASPGTTTITASYNGLSAAQSVQVVAAPPTHLIHRYSFNGGTASDSFGTANGVFYNASGNAAIANGQLNLVGAAGDYVDFGPGIITTTNITTGALTLEAWATFNVNNGAWARLFDFGNISGSSGGNYLFLAANNAANGGTARFAVTDSMPGGSGETGFNLNNFLGETNIHLVAVFNPSPGRQFLGLYTNGVLAASGLTGGKYIASINDAFSFLGHSLWSGDAWLNGSINEFRIYDGELNKFQIAASDQAGPDQTNYNVGSVTGLSLNPGTLPMGLYATRQLAAWLGFSLASNVNVTGDPELTLSSDNTNVFTVGASGLLNATGVGTANLTGIYEYVSGNTRAFYTNSVMITVDKPSAILEHRYSFTSDASDLVGGAAWNGTLPNGGTFANGQLALSAASSQYVQLPSGILGNYPAVSIEAWATFPDQLPGNCFFYGFGNTDSGGAGENYIFCAPQGGRIAITGSDPGYIGEQNASGAGDFSYHTNFHLVAVYDPPDGYLALYTNGVLVAMDSAVTVPMSSVTSVLNFIGRSLYNVDPYPDLSIDEFRIYKGVLYADEIAASQVLGPNLLLSSGSPSISSSLAGNDLRLSWPLALAGFTLMTTTNLTIGTWEAVNPSAQIVGNQWQTILPVSRSVQFFRLQR